MIAVVEREVRRDLAVDFQAGRERLVKDLFQIPNDVFELERRLLAPAVADTATRLPCLGTGNAV